MQCRKQSKIQKVSILFQRYPSTTQLLLQCLGLNRFHGMYVTSSPPFPALPETEMLLWFIHTEPSSLPLSNTEYRTFYSENAYVFDRALEIFPNQTTKVAAAFTSVAAECPLLWIRACGRSLCCTTLSITLPRGKLQPWSHSTALPGISFLED